MRRSSVFMAIALLMSVSCKKPEPPPPPPPPPAPPTVRVQIISVDPSRVDVGTPFSAQVFGSGFQDGAEVYVGTTRIAAAERYDSNTIEISSPPLLRGTHDVMVKNPDGTSHTLRNAITSRSADPTPPPNPTAGLNCNAITINFGFDSSSLSDSARGTLKEHLLCFTAGTSTVRIEGHADERGTTAYNLALGQRRADTVKRWMSAQGVPSSRLRTVSFGEEQPVDPTHSEAAWARNRRSEISAPR